MAELNTYGAAIVSIWTCLLLVLGCSRAEPPTVQVEVEAMALKGGSLAWEKQARAPQAPDGFSYTGQSLFGLDRKTAVITTGVQGHAGYSVQGRLANDQGQRTLVLVHGQREFVIADPGWLSPPVAAMNAQGEILICYNRFIGETSQLTEGMLPDPTQGVDALCRSWKKGRMDPEVQVGSAGRKASWVISMNAQPNGQFRLQYLADDGWLMDPSPKHHFLAQNIEDGLVVSNQFLRPALDEAR